MERSEESKIFLEVKKEPFKLKLPSKMIKEKVFNEKSSIRARAGFNLFPLSLLYPFEYVGKSIVNTIKRFIESPKDAIKITPFKALNIPYQVTHDASLFVADNIVKVAKDYNYRSWHHRPDDAPKFFAGLTIMAFYNTICIYGILKVAQKFNHLKVFHFFCKHNSAAYAFGALVGGLISGVALMGEDTVKGIENQNLKTLTTGTLVLGGASAAVVTAGYGAKEGFKMLSKLPKKQLIKVLGIAGAAILGVGLMAGLAIMAIRHKNKNAKSLRYIPLASEQGTPASYRA